MNNAIYPRKMPTVNLVGNSSDQTIPLIFGSNFRLSFQLTNFFLIELNSCMPFDFPIIFIQNRTKIKSNETQNFDLTHTQLQTLLHRWVLRYFCLVLTYAFDTGIDTDTDTDTFYCHDRNAVIATFQPGYPYRRPLLFDRYSNLLFYYSIVFEFSPLFQAMWY